MYTGIPNERNPDATIYVGDLDSKVNESLLWELFLQAGPVVSVNIPKDKVSLGSNNGYGFVEFQSEADADYAQKVMTGVRLYGKPLRINKSAQTKKQLDVGANIFIGQLDPEVDEKLLFNTFSAFGNIVIPPKIMRDPDTGISKGFGFLGYDSFDSSDDAINAMNGQFLCNKAISVGYAMKKDSKDRHGSGAERLLAANRPSATARKAVPSNYTISPVAASLYNLPVGNMAIPAIPTLPNIPTSSLAQQSQMLPVGLNPATFPPGFYGMSAPYPMNVGSVPPPPPPQPPIPPMPSQK